ncbi:ComF family protein [Enterococcus sp. BWM-S5]|uniref:ComF family protein n=2 Tax=Enterococcus larvae TaxID=2794352 RepID=A0ABS4CGG6_9ENTE|nr:ComF family protein [Enterococcus larvae]
MNCVYCSQRISRILSIRELICFHPLPRYELCINCQKKFQLLEGHQLCNGCGRKCSSFYCSDCHLWQKKYPDYSFHHTALFQYDDEMKLWFEEYKFKGNYQLRHSFSQKIAVYFKKKKNFLVIPIPLSKNRLSERGFNQVEGLLKGAAVDYTDCLVRTGSDQPQSKKGRKERLSGHQPFHLCKTYEHLLADRNVLLVDDIYTTGRTLFFASEIILKYPVKKLETFSVAR